MNAIQVYIWGVRYGFTEGSALFPERNRLTDASEIQHYDTICRYFTSAKDVAFRSGQRDFYFLMQDHQYQIYSLVDKSHQDIAGREAYLVYSIVCPKSNNIGGNIKDELQNLKNLYKTRNADYTIRTNMFTNDQVRSVISNLTLSSGNTRSIGTNTVCYFQNESELNLNDFSGNEVYFMQTGSNPELPTHLNLSVQQLNLGQLNQENQKKSQSVGEFRTLLSSKSNFQKANELYNTVSSALNENERALFENWKSEEKGKIELVNLKNLIDQYSKNKSKDISPCENLIAQNKNLFNALNETEKSLLSQWRDEIDKNKKLEFNTLITDIEFEINNAEEHEYKNSITELEAKLNKEIEERLSVLAQSNLKKWRQNQKENTIVSDVTALYSEIKKLDENNDRRAILSRQKKWIKKIDDFAQRIDGKNLLHGSVLEQYKYLYDGKWQRKERPIAKIATIALVVMLTGGGFFSAKKWDVWFPPVAEVNKDKEVNNETDQQKDSGNQTTSAEESKYTSLKYNNNDYLVEKSLLTEAGSKYGDGKTFGNGCTYRYLKDKNKWEMKKSDFDKTWTEAKPSDIPIILKNWDAKFKTTPPVTPPITPPVTPTITPPVTPPTTPPVTTPPVTSPPKDPKPPKTPPTEIPKVTTPAETYDDVFKRVTKGECNADCIRKTKLSETQKQKLLGFLPDN